MQQVRFLVVARKLLVVVCGIYLPDQGSNPGPLHWEHEVLATGPPGKSLKPQKSWEGRRAVWIFPQTHFCLILQSLLQVEVCAHHHGLPVSHLLTFLLLHLGHPSTAPQRSQVSQPISSCSSSGMPCPATLDLETSFPDSFPASTAANSVTSSSVLTWPHLLHLLFFFFYFLKIFIYLAVLGLICGTWDL